jgi:hypothetical protein
MVATQSGRLCSRQEIFARERNLDLTFLTLTTHRPEEGKSVTLIAPNDLYDELD